MENQHDVAVNMPHSSPLQTAQYIKKAWWRFSCVYPS